MSFVLVGVISVPMGTVACVAMEHIAPESHNVRTAAAAGTPIFVWDMKYPLIGSEVLFSRESFDEWLSWGVSM